MPHAIEVNGVSKRFEAGARLPFRRKAPARVVQALSEVSLCVGTGEIFGLVGRNGYGKTTLIKCICSLLEPSQGNVRVHGHDAVRQAHEVRRCLGYVGADERSFYFRLTGLQNLLFFARLQGVDPKLALSRVHALAERFEIKHLLSRRFYEYSTGNRQRLSLVRALLHDPKVLVLDEPTRSLDSFAAVQLRRTLSAWVKEKPERSVLITSHNLDEVEELSSRVGIMTRGKLGAVGSLTELRARFDDRELIRLWTDRPADSQALREEFVDGDAPEFQCGADPVRGAYLEFRRKGRDHLLDRVIQLVNRGGTRLVSFERMEMSLQDIIEQVDARTLASMVTESLEVP